MKNLYLFFLVFNFLFSLNIFSCGEGCALHGKEILKSEEGVLKGKIVCMHCDLKKSDKCKPVLKTEDEKIFEICPDSLKDKKIDEHEGINVEVKAKIAYPKEGNPVIHIKELKELE